MIVKPTTTTTTTTTFRAGFAADEQMTYIERERRELHGLA